MARGFTHHRGRYDAVLDRDERRVVLELLEQTRELLAPDIELTGDPFTDLVAGLGEESSPTDPGSVDPALRRLLPDAHRADPEVAAEFRRLTEQDLRRAKVSNLDIAIAALAGGRGDPGDEAHEAFGRASGGRRKRSAASTVSLERAQALAMMAALNDVRLILGERLDLRDEDDIERRAAEADAEPRSDLAYAVALFEFLGWLQETLVAALSRSRG